MAKILVMVPAFNEHVKLQNTIERFLRSTTARTADYLVVDDCSTDGSLSAHMYLYRGSTFRSSVHWPDAVCLPMAPHTKVHSAV